MKQREAMVQRHEKGESFAHIAREMGLPYMTVRGICKHYERTGDLRPNYAACARPGVRKDAAIFDRAIDLKKTHPRWGAGLIWVELAEVFAESQLPSERTLQRWFRQAGVAVRREREQRQTPVVKRGQAVHDVWAMDAKEALRLADGTYASWLVISDEASGAILHTDLFPPQTVDHRGTAAHRRQHSNGLGNVGASAGDACG